MAACSGMKRNQPPSAEMKGSSHLSEGANSESEAIDLRQGGVVGSRWRGLTGAAPTVTNAIPCLQKACVQAESWMHFSRGGGPNTNTA